MYISMCNIDCQHNKAYYITYNIMYVLCTYIFGVISTILCVYMQIVCTYYDIHAVHYVLYFIYIDTVLLSAHTHNYTYWHN